MNRRKGQPRGLAPPPPGAAAGLTHWGRNTRRGAPSRARTRGAPTTPAGSPPPPATRRTGATRRQKGGRRRGGHHHHRRRVWGVHFEGCCTRPKCGVRTGGRREGGAAVGGPLGASVGAVAATTIAPDRHNETPLRHPPPFAAVCTHAAPPLLPAKRRHGSAARHLIGRHRWRHGGPVPPLPSPPPPPQIHLRADTWKAPGLRRATPPPPPAPWGSTSFIPRSGSFILRRAGAGRGGRGSGGDGACDSIRFTRRPRRGGNPLRRKGSGWAGGLESGRVDHHPPPSNTTPSSPPPGVQTPGDGGEGNGGQGFWHSCGIAEAPQDQDRTRQIGVWGMRMLEDATTTGGGRTWPSCGS